MAGLVIALNARRKVESLERRVMTLEREIARRPIPAPPAAAAASPAAATTTAPPKTTPRSTAATTASTTAPDAEPAPDASPAPAAGPAADPKPAAAAARAAALAASVRTSPRGAPPPKPPTRSLEERIGARWSVIVGGLALALGGIFLVRYSIEQGLIGPAARIALGAAFSAGLLALGERMRRSEAAKGRPRRPIDIPAVITSAGATSAFAVIYGAYALYGFLNPPIAFVALGAVAVATLVASVLHGPILGAVGLIGAHAAPLLVSTDEPNAVALYAYLLAPTTAAFAVARMRGWPILAGAAGIAAFLCGIFGIFGGLDVRAAVLLAYAVALIALAALTHSGAKLTPPAPDPQPDYVSSGLIGAFALLAVFAPAIDGFGAPTLVVTAMICAGLVALGVWAAGLAPVAAAGAVLATLVALSFDDAALAQLAEVTKLPDPGETVRSAGLASFLAFCAGAGGAMLALGTLGARIRPSVPAWWQGLLAASAVAAPLGLLAVAYWQVSDLAPDIRFAAIGVVLAGLFAWLTEDAVRRESGGPKLSSGADLHLSPAGRGRPEGPGEGASDSPESASPPHPLGSASRPLPAGERWAASPMATAAFATGAAAALGLALAMAMREGGLTVALAFLAMALGFVAAKRPIRALGWLAIVAGAIVAARIAIDPRIVGDDLGTTPIFNALLWGYGAPAAAFWLGARQFDKAGQTLPATVLEGLALLFALLLGFTEARHFANGGDMFAGGARLLEAGLDATVAFGLAAAAGRLNLMRASPALGWGALIAGGLGVVIAGLGLAFGANPLVTGETIAGGLILNDLVPGYLLPAIAALFAARFAGENRPAWLRRAFGAAALALAFGYVSLMVRRAFIGPRLADCCVSDPEWYAYSVVWLAFGLALLAFGVWRRSQLLRLASALVILAVVLKVFLFDLAGIGGVWRALSFMGLGGVLVGIGFVYQRLLFPKSGDGAAPA